MGRKGVGPERRHAAAKANINAARGDLHGILGLEALTSERPMATSWQLIICKCVRLGEQELQTGRRR
jgi:hypothetical protein